MKGILGDTHVFSQNCNLKTDEQPKTWFLGCYQNIRHKRSGQIYESLSNRLLCSHEKL